MRWKRKVQKRPCLNVDVFPNSYCDMKRTLLQPECRKVLEHVERT